LYRWTHARICRALLLTLGALIVPIVAAADPIVIYVAPDNTYQNSANNPCVFYGPATDCAPDPAGWPLPEGPTNNDFDTLTQTYTGADFDAWLNFVGDAFILGLDINDTNVAQTLDPFTISFFDGSSNLLGSYTLTSPVPVPGISNGVGYADYILAAGCSGTASDVATSAFDACSNYLPFVLPNGTASLSMTFGYQTGNDGPDKVFAIPQESVTVPEPAMFLLLGTGLVAAARRRFAKR
jgi:hypothetical protein